MSERIRKTISTDRLMKWGVIALTTGVTAHFVADGLEAIDRSKLKSTSTEQTDVCHVAPGNNIVFQRAETSLSGNIACDNGRIIEIVIPEGTGIRVETPQR